MKRTGDRQSPCGVPNVVSKASHTPRRSRNRHLLRGAAVGCEDVARETPHDAAWDSTEGIQERSRRGQHGRRTDEDYVEATVARTY